MILKCKTCGKEWVGLDEHDAETKAEIEPCVCREKISDLSMEELEEELRKQGLLPRI